MPPPPPLSPCLICEQVLLILTSKYIQNLTASHHLHCYHPSPSRPPFSPNSSNSHSQSFPPSHFSSLSSMLLFGLQGAGNLKMTFPASLASHFGFASCFLIRFAQWEALAGPWQTMEGRDQVLPLEVAHMTLAAPAVLAKCWFQITCSCSMELKWAFL